MLREEAGFQMHAGVHGGVYKVSHVKYKSVHNGSKPVVSQEPTKVRKKPYTGWIRMSIFFRISAPF